MNALEDKLIDEKVTIWENGRNFQWFILIFLLNILSSFINQSFILTDAIYYNSFGEQFAYVQIEQMIEAQNKWQWVGYLVLPIYLCIKLSLITLCLLAGTVWEERKISFSHIWSLILRVEVITALGGLVSIVYLSFLGDVNRLEDLQSFHYFSLLALVPNIPNSTAWYLYPLQVINLIEILYWVGLIAGIKFLLEVSSREGFRFIARTYGVGLLIWVLVVVFIKLNLEV